MLLTNLVQKGERQNSNEGFHMKVYKFKEVVVSANGYCFGGLFVIGVVIGILFGCTQYLPLKELPPQLVVERYEPLGKMIDSQVISADSPVYQKLKLFFDSERSGWKISFVSYGSGPYLFRSNEFMVSCFANFVVVDLHYSGRYISLEKRVPNVFQRLGLPQVDFSVPKKEANK